MKVMQFRRVAAAGAQEAPVRASVRVLASALLRAAAACLLLLAAPADAANDCRNRMTSAGWPAWESFATAFMGDGARVIDPSTPNGQTTSEGQAYALFFALVADDRPRFDRLLRWTEDNLTGGDLRTRLPAWLWGKKNDGSWGIIDDNPASDADLWIAYTLLEASRAWNVPRFAVLGQQVAQRILREETVVIDGLGRVLLPAPKGFMPANDTVRLNPSYAPLQVLRRLAAGSSDAESKAQWNAQVATTLRLILDGSPQGFVPDWVVYQAGKGFRADGDTAAIGSFNAIRTYLWAGMLAPAEPHRLALQKALAPMLTVTISNGAPPQQVDTRNSALSGIGDGGFSAALLPQLSQLPDGRNAAQQRARIKTLDPSARRDNYYEQALTLFGLGWDDRRYRFKVDGTLERGMRCNAR